MCAVRMRRVAEVRLQVADARLNPGYVPDLIVDYLYIVDSWQTVDQLHANYPHVQRETIRRACSRLVEAGALEVRFEKRNRWQPPAQYRLKVTP